MVSQSTELRVALAMRRKTARDVAVAAGISPFELSRILNDKKSADPAVIARIRRAIFDDPEPAA